MFIGMIQVFVLMQFDPGLEYKPNRGEAAANAIAPAPTAGSAPVSSAVANNPIPNPLNPSITNKDDPS